MNVKLVMVWGLRGVSSLANIGHLRLQKQIEREMRFEGSFSSSSSFLSRYLSQHQFVLKSQEESSFIELQKRKEDYSVTVLIRARIPEIDVEKEDAIRLTDAPEASDSEDDSVLPDVSRLYITIARDDCSRGLLLSASTRQSTLLFSYLTMIKMPIEMREILELESPITSQYKGPNFHLLSTVLPTQSQQTHWLSVLKWLGIDSDLAKASECLSLVKEQAEYQAWLKRFHEFLVSRPSD